MDEFQRIIVEEDIRSSSTLTTASVDKYVLAVPLNGDLALLLYLKIAISGQKRSTNVEAFMQHINTRSYNGRI